MKLIVGLGNPGARYERTRHNIGFVVIDALAASGGFAVSKKQCQALTGTGFLDGVKVILAKPQTYMNLSGNAVLQLLNYYGDRIDDLLVIHDDLDLDIGRIRFKSGGGTGGHKGLKSVSEMLNSSDYCRLKIGIGRPSAGMGVESFVLSSFTPEEMTIMREVVAISLQGIVKWCKEGIERAMNSFNATTPNGNEEEGEPTPAPPE